MKLKYLLLPLILFPAYIFAQPCTATVDAGPDMVVCASDGQIELNGMVNGGGGLTFSWSPTTGLSDPSVANPIATVTAPITYTLTAEVFDTSANLIVNGNFEMGNEGFTSDYNFSNSLWSEGNYSIIHDPSIVHSAFAPCGDHTSGDGNMLVVNGASGFQDIWCQDIVVQPNIDYAFSAWVASVTTTAPAELQFSINGVVIGNIFNATDTNCSWEQFYTLWNSGTTTTAQICVVNQNTAAVGNDFALDDIYFSPYCEDTDEVTLTPMQTVATAVSPLNFDCENPGGVLQLDATGSSTGANVTYEWETMNGNIVSGENTLTPTIDEGGTYTLNVVFNDGITSCLATAEVVVTDDPSAPVAMASGAGELDCSTPTLVLSGQGSSTAAGSQYQWEALAGGNIASGATSLAPVIDEPGTYVLLVSNTGNNCTDTDTVTVTETVFEATSDITQPLCSDGTGMAEVINASGGTEPYLYAVDGGSFADQPVFAGLTPGVHVLAVQDAAGCVVENEIEVIAPPALQIFLTPEVSLDLGDSYLINPQLNIDTAQVASYTWSPADFLSCENCLTPNAMPTQNTTYTLTVEDTAGCTGMGQIQFYVAQNADVFIPNIFSPNEDGINDFFYVFAKEGSITTIKSFDIFDRWGDHVYSATDFPPNKHEYGWDGTFRGKRMNTGIFAYFTEIEFIDGRTERYEGDVMLVK